MLYDWSVFLCACFLFQKSTPCVSLRLLAHTKGEGEGTYKILFCFWLLSLNQLQLLYIYIHVFGCKPANSNILY
jgi:hypothetical protein